MKHFKPKKTGEIIHKSIQEDNFNENKFDEHFSKSEKILIDTLIYDSIKKREFISEKELNKILLC